MKEKTFEGISICLLCGRPGFDPWVGKMPWVLGAVLGIADKMQARPQPPLLVLKARSQDEGVRSFDSDFFFFLSSVELARKNVKVLIVLERSMRRHKAFCSYAQRIIHKVNH